MRTAKIQDLRNLSADVKQRLAPSDIASEYHRAFALYGPLCFWSTREMETPSIGDVLDAASRLKREGNMASRSLAIQLEEACRAAI